MKKYYLIIAETMYDGWEFHQYFSFERNKIVTQKEADSVAEKNILHEDTGEELGRVELIKISKKSIMY